MNVKVGDTVRSKVDADCFSLKESDLCEVSKVYDNGSVLVRNSIHEFQLWEDQYELVTPAPTPADDGGPAFPVNPGDNAYGGTTPESLYGMSIREYAAIHLRVPCSGVDWLDEMINQSRRDAFAGQAMQAIICAEHFNGIAGAYGASEEASFFEIAAGVANTQAEAVAWRAYVTADAMLEASKGVES